MREIGRGLEMPAPPSLDKLDAAGGIIARERAKRRLDVGARRAAERFAQPGGVERLLGSEERGFDGAGERLHRRCYPALRSRSGPKISSCASSARPSRASSSAATKLEASALRRSAGSA
jgi:uncharacterized membrane-anchored protein